MNERMGSWSEYNKHTEGRIDTLYKESLPEMISELDKVSQKMAAGEVKGVAEFRYPIESLWRRIGRMIPSEGMDPELKAILRNEIYHKLQVDVAQVDQAKGRISLIKDKNQRSQAQEKIPTNRPNIQIHIFQGGTGEVVDMPVVTR